MCDVDMTGELLALRIRDLISRREMIVAIARREQDGGGWRCNWEGAANEIDQELDPLWAQVRAKAEEDDDV